MKTFCRVLCVALCCLIPSAFVLAADAQGSAPAQQPSEEEMMQQWMKLSAPGEHHALLKPLAGSWKTTSKTWMGPGEPKVSEGSCEYTWIMGDRYLKQECTGTMGGMAFQGMGLTGYDNLQKKFVGIWVDSGSTGIFVAEGKMDMGKKVLSMHGKAPDEQNLASGKLVAVKMETKIVDENTHIFSYYEVRQGKDVLTMEITYKRK
jgi:hypothetical protein